MISFQLTLALILTLSSTLEITMEQVNFGYSTKNIPAPSQKEYLKNFIAKTEKFIRAIRWRTYFFLNPDDKPKKKETYGFKSTLNTKPIRELKQFEDGMLDLIQNIKFKPPQKQFQKKLQSDAKTIRKEDKLFVAADKTTNFYKLKHDQYDKLLQDNVTKSYKKTTKTTQQNISLTDKEIATKLNIDDRMDTTAKTQAFVTLKDHKDNFNNKPACRLINPSKSELGRVSKKILEKVNRSILENCSLNQWKNTDEVIGWFSKINSKSNQTFICFDVREFYPSITKELLMKAIEFASIHTAISEQDKELLHMPKNLYYMKIEIYGVRKTPLLT